MPRPATHPCPSLEDLELAAAAPTSDPALQSHLDSCPTCRRQLDDIRANLAILPDLARVAIRPRSTAPEAPPVHIEGYQILREIHRGGQGIVYEALQLSTRRKVALKMLLQGAFATPRQRLRFEREAELVASLRHPGIVTVHDTGITADGRHYLVMELIDGVPLDRLPRATDPALRVSGSGSAPIEPTLRLFAKICDAVNYAHQRGVIHRDLKPANILIDPGGEPHVLDFGLAKHLGAGGDAPAADATMPGEFLGTFAYAAPEQLSGNPDDADVRTDVYALGVILFELLTGRSPYPPAPSPSIRDLLRQIAEAEPVRPSTLRRDIDRDLETIALTALAKDPARRYQSAGALAADIRHQLAREPIDARKDSAWYVLRKSARRYRLPIAVGVLFVVLVLAAAIVAGVLYQQARLEARKANTIRIFLEDTLGSVESPTPGQETTVRQTLDEAVHWVDLALRGQPEVEASIRTTIGNSYRALGRFDDARAQAQRALELRRALFGERHPQVAQSLNVLGLVARDEGDLPLAERLFTEALAIRRARLGPRHPDVAGSLMNLASVKRASSDPAGARRLLEEALAIRRDAVGENHPDYAMALFQLAQAIEQSGDTAEAERLHRQALDIRKRTLHPEHPDIARSERALAEVVR